MVAEMEKLAFKKLEWSNKAKEMGTNERERYFSLKSPLESPIEASGDKGLVKKFVP